MKQERIDIILPNRIGDSIMSLPVLVGLKQLQDRWGPEQRRIRVLTHVGLTEILREIVPFCVEKIDIHAKVQSILSPADKAFFLTTTSKNIGLRARETYGLRQPNKWLLQYTHDLSCLHFNAEHPNLPRPLVNFLSVDCRLPLYPARQFGICLELGYSPEQIMETVTFNREQIAIPTGFFAKPSPVKRPYVVLCLEAAYGRKKFNTDRRWPAEHFLAIAAEIWQRYSVKVVLIGIATEPLVSVHEGLIDLRKKLNLTGLTRLLHGAIGYVGNDTGPLHLANLVGCPTIGVYAREDYPPPLFPDSNRVFSRPENPIELLPAVTDMIRSRLER